MTSALLQNFILTASSDQKIMRGAVPQRGTTDHKRPGADRVNENNFDTRFRSSLVAIRDNENLIL